MSDNSRLDITLDPDDSFKTWEKMCEESYPKITEMIDLTSCSESTQNNSLSYAASADNEETRDDTSLLLHPEIFEETIHETLSPLPGSCDFLKSMLDPNTAICNLNDTLDTVDYILALSRGAHEKEEELQHVSTISIVSSDESVQSVDEEQSGEHVNEETIDGFGDDLDVNDIESFIEKCVNVINDSPTKCPRKTGKEILCFKN